LRAQASPALAIEHKRKLDVLKEFIKFRRVPVNGNPASSLITVNILRTMAKIQKNKQTGNGKDAAQRGAIRCFDERGRPTGTNFFSITGQTPLSKGTLDAIVVIVTQKLKHQGGTLAEKRAVYLKELTDILKVSGHELKQSFVPEKGFVYDNKSHTFVKK
jgi:hypothetical protein